MSQTKKTITFYRIHGGLDPETLQLRPMDFFRIMQNFAKEPYELRQAPTNDAIVRVFGEVKETQNLPAHMFVAKVKTGDLPEKELDGKWTTIRTKDKEGIGYRSHAVLFSGGILGFMPASDAGTISHFQSLFTCRNSELNKILRIEPLLRGDPLARLKRGTVSKFIFTINQSEIQQLQTLNPVLANALTALHQQVGAETFTIGMQVSRQYGKNPSGFKTAFNDFASSVLSVIRFAKIPKPKAVATVCDPDETASTLLNLLTDKFTVEQTIEHDRGKRYSDHAAFKAIEEVYDKHQDELQRAAFATIKIS